jgi:hypothetical protein
MGVDLKTQGREVSALWQSVRAIAGEDDDQTVIDTVDGEGDAIQALRYAVRLAIECETNAGAVKALEAEYRDRRKVLEGRAERYRQSAAAFLQEVGEKSLRLPEATISWRHTGPQLVGDIPAAADLPDHCIKLQRVKHEPSIKAALEAGENIAGLSLSNGGVGLTVRKA